MQKQIRKNPIVSVIIPAYNRPQLLIRTVKSVMAQTFKETAHLNIDKKKYNENYDKIFGKDKRKKKDSQKKSYIKPDDKGRTK